MYFIKVTSNNGLILLPTDKIVKIYSWSSTTYIKYIVLSNTTDETAVKETVEEVHALIQEEQKKYTNTGLKGLL